MSITARRLNRATLGRQLLLRREPLDVAEAVRRVVALQAQSAPSPYLLRRPVVRDALWDSTLLSYADRSRVNGDVLPTLLVHGYVPGVWRPVEGGSKPWRSTSCPRGLGRPGRGGDRPGGVPGRPRTPGLPPLHPLVGQAAGWGRSGAPWLKLASQLSQC